jgi:hypothetical protein
MRGELVDNFGAAIRLDEGYIEQATSLFIIDTHIYFGIMAIGRFHNFSPIQGNNQHQTESWNGKWLAESWPISCGMDSGTTWPSVIIWVVGFCSVLRNVWSLFIKSYLGVVGFVSTNSTFCVESYFKNDVGTLYIQHSNGLPSKFASNWLQPLS